VPPETTHEFATPDNPLSRSLRHLVQTTTDPRFRGWFEALLTDGEHASGSIQLCGMEGGLHA
jgi:hypothetical protein